MVFTDGLDVDIGDSTRAVDHDTLADNPEWLRDKANQEHDFDISTGDGKHKDISFKTGTGNIIMNDDKSIGFSGAGRFTFDSTASPDEIRVNNATLNIRSPGVGSHSFRVMENAGVQYVCDIFEDGTDSAGILRLYDGAGAGKIYLDGNGVSYFNGGNVGINDATPADKLSIQGNVGIGSTGGHTATYFLDIRGSGTDGIEIDMSGSTSGIALLDLRADRTSDGNDAGRIRFINAGASPVAQITAQRGTTDLKGNLLLVTSNSTAMTIDEDGNVGIGDTSPDALLDVHGNVIFGDGASGNLKFDVGTAATMDIYLTTSDAADSSQVRIGAGGDVTNARGAMITLAGNEHANTGRMRLDAGNDAASGNIALYTQGTLTLDVQYDGDIVYTPGAAGKGLFIRESDDGNDAFAIKAYTTGAQLDIYTAGVSVVRFDSTSGGTGYLNLDGGLTIGSTTAPETDLMIENDLWIGGDDANANRSGGENSAPSNLVINNDVASTAVAFRLKDAGVTTYSTIDSGQDDIWAVTKNYSGGGLLQYWMCGDTADTHPHEVIAMGGTASATHTTAGRALVEFTISELSSGVPGDMVSTGNAFGIRTDRTAAGGTLTAFLVTENGDIHHDGVAAAMDFEVDGTPRDDVAMLSAFDWLRDPKGVIDNEWEDFTRYHEHDLVRAGLLGDTLANGGLVNLTGLSRFHTGSIRQLERKKADRIELAREVERRELLEATVADQQALLMDAHEIIDRLTHQLKEGNG